MIYCCSSDHAEGLQPDVVAFERLLEVDGQLLAVALGRAAIEPDGVRTEKEQAASTCRSTCRTLALLGYTGRTVGIYFEVEKKYK